ncbi:glycerophosphodiester phosphodiesterase [Xylanibacillus composti]|nr:glycerophosphodiester phosphodiesterase family protein [Xylanibacillus composti]
MMKKWHRVPTFIIVVVLIGIVVLAGLAETTGQAYAKGDVVVVAHRGASGLAPENTIAAFDLALELRADYLELDVQMSRDGHLVVIHDPSVNRTTNGRGLVRDKLLHELQQLDAGGRFSKEYTGERIPLLEEVLERYWGRIGLLIELKEPSLYPGMVEKTLDMVGRLERSDESAKSDEMYAEQVIIQSFDRDAIRSIREQMPDMATAVLIRSERKRMLAEDWEALAAYADYVNPHQSLVTARFVENAHAYNLKVIPWTVRKPSEARRLIHAGVDGLITDYP